MCMLAWRLLWSVPMLSCIDYTRPLRFIDCSFESNWHSDSSDALCHPYVVGLQCITPAQPGHGGELMVTNAANAYAALTTTATAAELISLQKPLVSELITSGLGAHSPPPKQSTQPEVVSSNRMPVLAPGAADPASASGQPPFIVRYMRLWLERGSQDANEPLDARTLAALDKWDAALEASPRIRMSLQPGQIVFVNNKTLLHNRKAFSTPEGTPPRHMVRVWLGDQ